MGLTKDRCIQSISVFEVMRWCHLQRLPMRKVGQEVNIQLLYCISVLQITTTGGHIFDVLGNLYDALVQSLKWNTYREFCASAGRT